MVTTKTIDYHDREVTCSGFLAWDASSKEKRPIVLIAHDWGGRGEFANQKAMKLAELGYVGFAIDMFGNGVTATTKEEKAKLIAPLVGDRMLLQHRMLAAFDFAKKFEFTDTKKIGAIGFCFGGLCVLDLARGGADVSGVVSFHGILNAPPQPNKNIKAKVLALHGHDDPMVPPEQVAAFEKEMTHAKVDWQLHIYGNTKHAFTNPEANDPGFGTVYNKEAEHRSWITMKNFFAEIF